MKKMYIKNTGFTLIEIMIVLVIVSLLATRAVQEYQNYLLEAKITKAKVDIADLIKAIRLYNLREDNYFSIATFSKEYLGSFVGKYLEVPPPLDPWGMPYMHEPDLGLVYSTGPNKKPDFINGSINNSDDILEFYLPYDLYITRAEYIDANRNGQIDYGDEVEITFSKPAKMLNVNVTDFITSNPENAFGNAYIIAPPKGRSLKIIFHPPLPPRIVIGETKVRPAYGIFSITDCASPPNEIKNYDDIVITKRNF